MPMSVTPAVSSTAALAPLTPLAQTAAVAFGGAVGSVLRWRMTIWLAGLQWPVAPGILAVNLIGGALIGFSLVAFDRTPSDGWRLLLVTGGLGGLTTFSSFSGESLSLLIRGEWALAVGHTLLHVIGALAAAALGWQIGRWVLA